VPPYAEQPAATKESPHSSKRGFPFNLGNPHASLGTWSPHGGSFREEEGPATPPPLLDAVFLFGPPSVFLATVELSAPPASEHSVHSSCAPPRKGGLASGLFSFFRSRALALFVSPGGTRRPRSLLKDSPSPLFNFPFPLALLFFPNVT